MRNEIRDIQQRLGITAVFVTHDQAEALTMCDKVVVMNRGRLEQMGTPIELYEQPQHGVRCEIRRAHEPHRARRREMAAPSLPASGFAVPAGLDGPVNIMMRPHRIAIGATGGRGGGAISSRQRSCARSSSATSCNTMSTLPGRSISVELATRGGEAVLAPGTAVTLSWRPQDVYVFGAPS